MHRIEDFRSRFKGGKEVKKTKVPGCANGRAKDLAHYCPLLAGRTPGLQLLEEVVALVIDEDKGREVLDGDLPDSLHAQLRILYALDAFDARL
jgi:hypothetical protein